MLCHAKLRELKKLLLDRDDMTTTVSMQLWTITDAPSAHPSLFLFPAWAFGAVNLSQEGCALPRVPSIQSHP